MIGFSDDEWEFLQMGKPIQSCHDFRIMEKMLARGIIHVSVGNLHDGGIASTTPIGDICIRIERQIRSGTPISFK